MKKSIIEKAKVYAQKHKISLSKLVEIYLESISDSKKTEPENTPLVKSLTGVIKLDSDYDYKKDYSDFLDKKHK